jgi:hypothetical protein
MSGRSPPAGRAIRFGLIGLGACVFALAAYYPVVAHLNSTVLLAPGDMTSSARDAWAAGFQHKSPFSLVRDTFLDAPQGRLAAPAVQIANALQPLFVLAVHGFAGYLGAFNLFMLFGVAASLAAMFVLLESLGMHPLAAGAGAIGFGSSQWSIEQLLYGHVAFAQLWVFPLLLGTLLWALRGRPIRSVVPGLVYALSFYAFSYLGLLSSLVVLVFMVALAWDRRSVRPDLRRLALGAGAAIIGLLPVALAPVIAPSSRIGLPQRARADLFGAAARDFFLPSTRHAVYGQPVKALVGSHVGESVLFFGYGTMALACVAVAMFLSRRLPISLPLRFALLAVPFGWFAALPARETLLGVRVTLPDPAEAIGGVVSWWRVYDRFAAVAGFGLVLLASAAIDRLIRSGRRAQRTAAGLGIALIILEALPGLPVPTFRIQADAATVWLRAHPGGIVANYPVENRPADPAAYEDMYWSSYYLQIYHHHPIYELPHGVVQPTASTVAEMLTGDLSSRETPSILRAEGVRWVVLHPDVYHALRERVPRLAHGFSVAAKFSDEQVLRVTAPPANLRTVVADRSAEAAFAIAGYADTEFGDGFYGSEHYDGWKHAHWLKQDGKLQVSTALALPYIVYDLQIWAFSAKVPHTVDILENAHRVASFVVPTSGVFIDRRLSLPGTDTTLTFTATPGPSPLGPSDPRLTTVYFESIRVAPIGLKLLPG